MAKKLVTYDQLNKLAKGIYTKLHGEVVNHTTVVAKALDAIEKNVKANADAIKTINDAENGILKQAKDYADGKDTAIQAAKAAADAAQADVDALEGVVGNKTDAKEVDSVFGKIAKAQAQADKGVADAAAVKVTADQAAQDITDMKNADDSNSLAGQIKANKDAITILNGGIDQAGSVDKKISDAEGRVAQNYATKAELGAANKAIEKAQGDITNLAGKVGDVAEGKTNAHMKTEAKTEATYDDTALAGRVQTIENDYLKTVDKTELSGAISGVSERVTANANAIATEKERLDTFFASADIGGAALDTLKEIQDYITSDGEAAATMTQNIANNKAAIDTINNVDTGILAKAKTYADEQDETLHTEISAEIDADVKVVQDALNALEGIVGDAQSGLVQQVNTNKTNIGKLQSALGDVEKAASAAALAEVKGEVQGIKDEIGTKAVAGETPVAATGLYKLIDDEATRAKGVEAGLRTDVDALKGTVGNASKGLVKDVATLQGQVANLQTSNHTHENKAVLDAITAADMLKVTGNASQAGSIAEAKAAADTADAKAEGLAIATDQSNDAKVVIQLKDKDGGVQSTAEINYEFVTDDDINTIITNIDKA